MASDPSSAKRTVPSRPRWPVMSGLTLWRARETSPHLVLTHNDLQQCLRMAFGGVIGFVMCKLAGWNYGTFFVVYPILLLGLVPTFTPQLVRQFLASMLLPCAYTLVVQGLLGDHPGAMLMVTAAVLAGLFTCMTRGPLFVFGGLSVVGILVHLNFASYPTADISDLVMSNVVATVTSLVIAMLMHTLFPDRDPRPPRKPLHKPLSNQRHEVILATSVATLSYCVFQTFNLSGSLSAQVASILVLFPLNWHGAGNAALKRALGTLVGCNIGLLIQMVLVTHYNVLWFVSVGLWVSLMFFARHHMHEGGGSGAGFGAMTTMAILFGQYLTPTRDLVYSALYRTSSVAFAVTCSLIAIYLMHHLLNRFAATRLLQPGD